MANLYSQYASGLQFTAGLIVGSSLGVSGLNPIVDRLNSISPNDNLISGTSLVIDCDKVGIIASGAFTFISGTSPIDQHIIIFPGSYFGQNDMINVEYSAWVFPASEGSISINYNLGGDVLAGTLYSLATLDSLYGNFHITGFGNNVAFSETAVKNTSPSASTQYVDGDYVSSYLTDAGSIIFNGCSAGTLFKVNYRITRNKY